MTLRSTILYVAIGLTVLAITVVASFWVFNRSILVIIDADIPASFASREFEHEMFEKLLMNFVDAEGNVDYEGWHYSSDAQAQLNGYLAAVSAYSPDATPARFPRRSDALAYWLYAYNAYVIRSILDHWPLDSVTDVKAPIEAVTGLGFFYQQRFMFGGRPYSLYAVENKIIRPQYKDPRIHFVLNCASSSCPVLRPELPSGEALEQLLADATIDFIDDPANVRVDHENRKVFVSTIFKWYKKDFVNEVRRRGLPSDHGVLDYILLVAPAGLKAELDSATNYDIEYADYDWALNRQ